MTLEQEDKIIAQAKDILERRMAVEKNIKINLNNLVVLGAYYQGALDAAKSIIANYVWGTFRGDDKIYRDAELNLIKSSKRNMQLFIDGTKIAYRNHKRYKSGKLEMIRKVRCFLTKHYSEPDITIITCLLDAYHSSMECAYSEYNKASFISKLRWKKRLREQFRNIQQFYIKYIVLAP